MRRVIVRGGQSVLTFATVLVISFVLFQMLPGGPVEAMRAQILQNLGPTGGSVDTAQLRRLVQEYTNIRPDAPMHVQFYAYVESIVLNQDLGTSIYKGEAVTTLILQRLPWTTFIGVYAMIIGYLSSIFIGSVMAYKERSALDSGLSVVLTGLNSIPYYIVGVLLIYVFAVNMNLLPSGGRLGSGVEPGFSVAFFVSALQHALLPMLSIAALLTNSALTLRENAVRALGEDYIRVAELRGINDARMAVRYVGHNAILPMYTKILIGIAGVFSSTVIVEQIFSYPGVGLLMYNAVITRDYPLLMGTMICFTGITVTAILVGDLSYGFLDPRLKGGSTNE